MPSSPRTPRSLRLVATAAATSLVAAGAVVLPGAALAADPQVCRTVPTPTADTRPWRDFATSPNPLPAVADELTAAARDAARAVGVLGPTSTEPQVAQVRDTVHSRVRRVYDALRFATYDDLDVPYGRLRNDLDLVDPTRGLSDADQDAVDAVHDGLRDLEAALDAVTADGSAYDAWEQGVLDRITFPVTGAVVLPSPDALAASITQVASAVDAWHALGAPRVVWGPPSTTCATTASLAVPAVSTVVGRGASVTVRATRDGAAVTGDFVVLLDGREVGAVDDATSYDVALPAAQTAGRRVLTVAFVPADGSPLSTRSSTVSVARAPTRTTLRVVADARAKVRVRAPGTALRPAGSVVVRVDGRALTATLRRGRASLDLGRLASGRHRVRAVYAGSGALARSASKPVRVTVR